MEKWKCTVCGYIHKVRAEMAENDVFDVVAVLEDHIAGYNKELWFLNSMLA